MAEPGEPKKTLASQADYSNPIFNTTTLFTYSDPKEVEELLRENAENIFGEGVKIEENKEFVSFKASGMSQFGSYSVKIVIVAAEQVEGLYSIEFVRLTGDPIVFGYIFETASGELSSILIQHE